MTDPSSMALFPGCNKYMFMHYIQIHLFLRLLRHKTYFISFVKLYDKAFFVNKLFIIFDNLVMWSSHYIKCSITPLFFSADYDILKWENCQHSCQWKMSHPFTNPWETARCWLTKLSKMLYAVESCTFLLIWDQKMCHLLVLVYELTCWNCSKGHRGKIGVCIPHESHENL